VPIIKVTDLTEQEQKQFIIKDNVSGGEWDWNMLANEWDAEELDAWGLDVPDFGKELEAEEDDFETPEGGIETDIVLGDLFEIGEHRLLCGDSTDSDAVAKLMDGQKADMVFTDPPYNVDYGNSNNPNHKSRTILNDKKSDKDWDEFVRGYMTNLLLFTNGNLYISMSDKELGHMQLMFEECGGRWASFIIWVKDRLILSGKDYHSRHETILYGWNEKIENRLRVEDRKQDDVWEIKRPTSSELHPTMKPIELIERMLNNSSKKGMNILDLFLGSGSTMVAAHQLNRKCYGMELDPKYCQVIVDRMRKLDPAIKIKRNGVDYGI
jgi:DNA modification methylase